MLSLQSCVKTEKAMASWARWWRIWMRLNGFSLIVLLSHYFEHFKLNVCCLCFRLLVCSIRSFWPSRGFSQSHGPLTLLVTFKWIFVIPQTLNICSSLWILSLWQRMGWSILWHSQDRMAAGSTPSFVTLCLCWWPSVSIVSYLTVTWWTPSCHCSLSCPTHLYGPSDTPAH